MVIQFGVDPTQLEVHTVGMHVVSGQEQLLWRWSTDTSPTQWSSHSPPWILDCGLRREIRRGNVALMNLIFFIKMSFFLFFLLITVSFFLL